MSRRFVAVLLLVVAGALVAEPRASSPTAEADAVVNLELRLGTGNCALVVDGVAAFSFYVCYFDAIDQSGSNVTTA